MENKNPFKEIMSVQLWKFTGDQMGKIKNNIPSEKYMPGLLPEYTFQDDPKVIDETKYYHQFTEFGEEVYILFDITHKDPYLEEELSHISLENLPVFIDKIPDEYFGGFDDYKRCYPRNLHLVFNLEFIGGGEDTECIITYSGYLENNNGVFSEVKN